MKSPSCLLSTSDDLFYAGKLGLLLSLAPTNRVLSPSPGWSPLPPPLAASLARTPHLLPDVSAASLANDIISAADVLSCSHPRSYVFLILALTSVYSEFARADMANNVRLEIHLREAYQSIAATRSLLLA